ncbi:MAG: RNA polymerase subunit sigma-24 [Azospira oryzae]|nr:MAG: RNA polymerase subunit sigma-24 [Azospira oryzae]PZP68825.1 MAG: RNA polymerase subunit sigma-24 [Delftia acidovorans]PZP83115.1 MAG: RNA polymerase subunit sigma-24 [Azospira oryzae]
MPRLRRYARALLGDRAEADDLVQDTLERAWRKAALWRPGSDLRAWLFAIMHNVFVNQTRTRRTNMEEPLDEAVLEHPAASDAAAGAQLLDLASALAKLPAEQREVVLLVGLEEFTYEEAARALGIPIGTVMSRLARGRERLRQLMSGGTSAPSLRVVK